jgi:hypothetical protein
MTAICALPWIKVVYKMTGIDNARRNPAGLVLSRAEMLFIGVVLSGNVNNERVQNMCMIGSTGWMNLHSLCPAREYIETVQAIKPRRLCSIGVSRRLGDSKNDQTTP